MTTKSLERAAHEQDAAGASVGLADVSCPVCGEDARLVAERNQPAAGPLVLEDFYTHLNDGDAYYHPDDDE